MISILISPTKIHRVSKDWANLNFEVKNTEKQLHITKRKPNAYYGYIDLINNKVVPNKYGACYQTELESILRDLIR